MNPVVFAREVDPHHPHGTVGPGRQLLLLLAVGHIPEQVRIVILTGVHEFAISSNYVDREKVVHREAEAAGGALEQRVELSLVDGEQLAAAVGDAEPEALGDLEAACAVSRGSRFIVGVLAGGFWVGRSLR